MGHTLEDWRRKTLDVLRDSGRVDVGNTQVDRVGVIGAIAEHSVNRPRELVVEAAGANSDTFDLPAGWVASVSELRRVEFPARQSPRVFLEDQTWELVPKTGALATLQIRLDGVRPGATEYVRFYFTAPWPNPVLGDPAPDVLDDLAFEAICALAASRCLNSLAVELARTGASGAPEIIAASKTLRGVYLRHIGLGDDAAGRRTAAPASASLDFDPQYFSLFHGGRR